MVCTLVSTYKNKSRFLGWMTQTQFTRQSCEETHRCVVRKHQTPGDVGFIRSGKSSTTTGCENSRAVQKTSSANTERKPTETCGSGWRVDLWTWTMGPRNSWLMVYFKDQWYVCMLVLSSSSGGIRRSRNTSTPKRWDRTSNERRGTAKIPKIPRTIAWTPKKSLNLICSCRRQ